MNIFNRREIFYARNMDDLYKACGKLSSGGVKYATKTNSILNSGRYHGTPNIQADYSYQYRVYVHKRDFERAKFLLSK